MIDMRDDAEIPYETLLGHDSNLIEADLLSSQRGRPTLRHSGESRRFSGRNVHPLLVANRLTNPRPRPTTRDWLITQLLDFCQSTKPVMPTSENDTQDTPLHGPNLILDVENFGPIAEAKNIEFKPMTVFVGPNSAGKTYLAMLVHAMLRARHESVPSQSNLDPIRDLGFNLIETDSLHEFTLNLRRIIANMSPSSTPYPENATLGIGVDGLNEASLEFLRGFVNDQMRLIAARFEIFIHRYFEVESLEALSNHSTKRNHCPSIFWSDTSRRIRLSPNNDSSSCEMRNTYFVIGSDLEDELRYGSIESLPELRREVLKSMNDYTSRYLDHLVYSHYIPTGRAGIMNSRHLLAAQLTARDQDYNWLARDFLSALVAVRAIRSKPIFSSRRFTPVKYSFGTNMKTEHVASVIEGSVLKGRIQVEDTPGLPEFYFVEGDNRIPTTSASSMVTDLAPLVMFVRSFVQIGDLLIIDEPEAHLHPTAQQQMAAALAFTVRSGIRVLIATHSHYMVEQLSNFVMAANLDDPQERKRLLGISGQLGDEDIYLDNHEIAVYDFAPQSPEGGSIVREVPFEDGYYPEDHIRAIGAQFNRNNRIETAVLGPE